MGMKSPATIVPYDSQRPTHLEQERARLAVGPWAAWLFALAATVAAPGAVAQETSASSDRVPDVSKPATPAPASPDETVGPAARSADPLEMDVDEVTSGLIARMLAIPRFEDEIEVRDRYQEALGAHLRASQLECTARPNASPGPPSHDELNRYSANPRPPSADLLTPAKLLFGKGKGRAQETPRFSLYSVWREDAPERVVYVVLDGPVAEGALPSVPGAAWKQLGQYRDRDEAADALRRLDRGNPATPRGERGATRTLWTATGCED